MRLAFARRQCGESNGVVKFNKHLSRESSSTPIYLEILIFRFWTTRVRHPRYRGMYVPVVTLTALPVESLSDSARLLFPLPRQVHVV